MALAVWPWVLAVLAVLDSRLGALRQRDSAAAIRSWKISAFSGATGDWLHGVPVAELGSRFVFELRGHRNGPTSLVTSRARASGRSGPARPADWLKAKHG